MKYCKICYKVLTEEKYNKCKDCFLQAKNKCKFCSKRLPSGYRYNRCETCFQYGFYYRNKAEIMKYFRVAKTKPIESMIIIFLFSVLLYALYMY